MALLSARLQLPEIELQTDPDTEMQLSPFFTTWSTTEVRLRNDSDERIAYCLRMTHPTDFVVVPSRGFLDPHDERYVRISRKPNVSPRTEDRFSVIYCTVLSDEYTVDLSWFRDSSVVRRKNITLRQNSQMDA